MNQEQESNYLNYFENNKMVFTGINGGQYLDKEDFEKYGKWAAEQLSSLQADNEKLLSVNETAFEQISILEKVNQALSKDNERLREALKGIGNLLEFAINATPTGAVRNLLTDANILAKAAITPIE